MASIQIRITDTSERHTTSGPNYSGADPKTSLKQIPGAAGLRGRRPVLREQMAKDMKSLDGHMRRNCGQEDKAA